MMRVITHLDEVTNRYKKSLCELFSHEYWTNNRTFDDVNWLLEHSSDFIIVVDEDSDEVVGFGRILTDGRHVMTLYDIIVKKEFRGEKIGKLMVNHILVNWKHIETIDLLCKDYNIDFYRKLGFQIEDSLHVMRIKNNH